MEKNTHHHVRRSVIGMLLLLGLTIGISRPEAAETVVVSAGAGLKDAFNEMRTAFEGQHPQVTLRLNFAGGPHLAGQIEQGAQVDLFGAANPLEVDRLAARNLVLERATIARNRMVVIVASGHARRITQVGDLATERVRLIIGTAQLPAGRYAREFIRKVHAAGVYDRFQERVMANVVSEETDVRSIALKVALGEGDAGVVYVSDITADIRDKVTVIPIAPAYNVAAEFVLARISSGTNAHGGRAFYEFVRSPAGVAILVKNGFLAP